MEPNAAHEMREHAERGAHEATLRPVAFTMSVLAVLVAVTTVLGHRTQTEAILFANQATDTWNEYQAHKIRSNDTALEEDLLHVTAVSDKAGAAKTADGYAQHMKKWDEEEKQEQDQATALEAKVEQAEARSDRLDLAEVLLEVALVITSITLLTRSRIYWYVGLACSGIGAALAVSAFLLK